MIGEKDLRRLRAETGSTRAHFNHAGMSLTPSVVLERVLAHLRLEAEMGGYEAAEVAGEEISAVPALLADLIGASAQEVCATESATRAWESVVWALAETFDYGRRDRVVVDRYSYATVVSTLAALHRSRGVEISVAPSLADGRIDPDALMARIDDRTRLVVATHMPTHVGTVSDVAALGTVLAGTGVVYALDISQTLGQMPVDVSVIGCDVAFAPGRKFLRAPRGTAMVYVRGSIADQLVPLALPFGAVDPADLEHLTLPPGLRRLDQFEYGVATRLGLGAAARYAMQVGLEAIGDTVAAVSQAVTERLGSFADLRLTGTEGDRGIISFVHRTMSPEAVRDFLALQGVNTWVNPIGGAPFDGPPGRLPSVRVSPHYITSGNDLDRLDQALGQLGRG